MTVRMATVLLVLASGHAGSATVPAGTVPRLSGTKIVYDEPHPFGAELFAEDGRWRTDVAMRGPVILSGTWRQDGPRVCIVVDRSNWSSMTIGRTTCRDVVVGKGRLLFRPVSYQAEMAMRVVPLDADDRRRLHASVR